MSQLDFFNQPSRPPATPPVAGSAVAVGAGIKRTCEYQDHIRSAQWRNTREAMFKLRGKKCERCPATSDLELHHLTYERFGRESPRDLEILCPRCHERADREREAELERAFEERCESTRYDNAKETYLDRVYGGYRAPWMDQEFDEWLERKSEDES